MTLNRTPSNMANIRLSYNDEREAGGHDQKVTGTQQVTGVVFPVTAVQTFGGWSRCGVMVKSGDQGFCAEGMLLASSLLFFPPSLLRVSHGQNRAGRGICAGRDRHRHASRGHSRLHARGHGRLQAVIPDDGRQNIREMDATRRPGSPALPCSSWPPVFLLVSMISRR
jgi:hypothetical protein